MSARGATVIAMRRVLIASVLVGVAALAAVRTPTVNAELEASVFASKAHRLRIVVPRGWRATDQPSYPGLLLWMVRGQPEGKMVLTAEPFTRAAYCSWPLECRTGPSTLPRKLACAMRAKLIAQRLTVSDPEDNAKVALPSVRFTVSDGKKQVLQAVAIGEDRIISLALSAASPKGIEAHKRAFDQALSSLRPLTDEEMGIPTQAPEAVVMQLVSDAGVSDAAPGSDAGITNATAFESAPVTKLAPVGPCAAATR